MDRRLAAADIAIAMDPSSRLLAELLMLAGLIAATAEYSHVIRRRVQRRQLESDRLAAQAIGLRGLVRVMLADA
jgi:5-enolpyruvylshikimate-3-phosphate synthase